MSTGTCRTARQLARSSLPRIYSASSVLALPCTSFHPKGAEPARTRSAISARQVALPELSYSMLVYEGWRTERSCTYTFTPFVPHNRISDGLQNNIFSITSTIFGLIYGSKVYTSTISTRIGNSLTVGTILGQVFIGIICDRVGRKAGIVLSTFFLVCGIILATAAVSARTFSPDLLKAERAWHRLNTWYQCCLAWCARKRRGILLVLHCRQRNDRCRTGWGVPLELGRRCRGCQRQDAKAARAHLHHGHKLRPFVSVTRDTMLGGSYLVYVLKL